MISKLRSCIFINRRTLSSNILENLNQFNEFFKCNISHLDNIKITINHPKNVSKFNVFTTHLYQAELTFQEETTLIVKKCNSNSGDELIEKMKEVLNNEIKLKKN